MCLGLIVQQLQPRLVEKTLERYRSHSRHLAAQIGIAGFCRQEVERAYSCCACASEMKKSKSLRLISDRVIEIGKILRLLFYK